MSCKHLRILTPVNGNDEPASTRVHEKQSGTMLRISLIASRDRFAPLPEEVLRDLHERLDNGESLPLPEHTLTMKRFERAITERLFPLRDERQVLVRLRLHSHVTAIAASVVAAQVKVPVQAAYVCGWLHDMGIASSIHHLDDSLDCSAMGPHNRAWELVLHSAPQHAVFLSSHWRLPSNLRFAIRDQIRFDPTIAPGALACVTFIAEHLAATQGCGFSVEQPASGLRPRLHALGLSERDLLPLARRTEQRIGHLELEWQSLRFMEGT